MSFPRKGDKYKKIMQNEEYKVVADLSIYDECGGTVEIVDMIYEHNALKTLKVKWVVLTTCYACQSFANLKDKYYEVSEVDAEKICELQNFRTMPLSKLERIREYDLKYETTGEVA